MVTAPDGTVDQLAHNPDRFGKVWCVFPRTVNEYAARLVAAGVVLLAVVIIVTGRTWLFVPLVGGFLARVIAGPRFSPLARAAVALAPKVRMVPGPPKRFAQGIGVVFSSTAATLALLGYAGWSALVLGALIAAAGLEAAAGICLGCRVYALLWDCPECDPGPGLDASGGTPALRPVIRFDSPSR